MCVLVAQSCPTLFDLIDCNPTGSSLHGILRQEYWSGLPFPSPEDLPNQGIKPGSPALQADFFFYHLSYREDLWCEPNDCVIEYVNKNSLCA